MQDLDRKMKCPIWFEVGPGQQCNRVTKILRISLSNVFFFLFVVVTVQKGRSSRTQMNAVMLVFMPQTRAGSLT